jgi:ABC-type branched-subunit amino acid transport system ATPase component
VYCNGQRIDGLAPWEIANKGVGRVFQDVRVFENMSVLDNVRVAFPSQKGEGLFGLLLHWGAVRRTEQEITRRAVEHLEFVGLGERTQVQGGQLSFGERKLLSLARLIATDAKVLLLDEPTSGVHPNMIPKILDLLRDFARDGRTLVVVEHDMSAIAEVADWAYCMDDGKLISSGPPDDVLKDPRVRAAYTGT